MKRTTDTFLKGTRLLDEAGVAKAIEQMTQLIVKEFASNHANLAFVGVQTRGVPLARRLATAVGAQLKQEIPVGILDITLYRDDLHEIASQPEVRETDIPFSIDDRPLVLVDDVLFTGRTVRSAMNALIDFGRPRCIRLAVLVDRGHRELPIGADYVGYRSSTKDRDIVDVYLKEVDGEDQIDLRENG